MVIGLSRGERAQIFGSEGGFWAKGFVEGDGLREPECDTQAEGSPGVEEAEEDGQLRTPREQTNDQASAAEDDLRGDEDEAL